MVTVSPNPWNGILSTFIVLGIEGDGGTDTKRGVATSLEDELFSPLILYFLAEGLTVMALVIIFYCRSWKPPRRLEAISSSSSSTSSMIDNMISSTFSHESTPFTSNVSSDSFTVS